MAGAAVISALKLGMAVYGALAARHNRNPIVKSLKRISLTDGLVSLAVTQYTLLELGRLSAGPQWAAAFGMGVGLLILWVGAGLVREGRLG